MNDAGDVFSGSLLLRIAACLYGLGDADPSVAGADGRPVERVEPPRGDECYDDGSGLCGLTLTAALVTPGEGDDDRIGSGLLSLSLAAPFAVSGPAKRR